MKRTTSGTFERREQFLWRIEVGEALGKIDRAMLV
jgi:hypothetical protein